MRFIKTATIGMFMFLMFAGGNVLGQADFDCSDVLQSTKDTVYIPFTEGRPGDTVAIPVWMTNDSIVTSFQFLIEYDSTWLSPVYIRDSICVLADGGGCLIYEVDTTYVEHLITGRMLKTDTTTGPFGNVIDTVNQFSINRYEDYANVLSCNQVPSQFVLDSLPRGRGNVFYMKFVVDPAMPHGTLSEFKFFESNIFTVNDTVFPPDTSYFNGCITSQYSADWRVQPDSTQNRVIYPTTELGFGFFFRADTGFVAPTTVDLVASADSVGLNVPVTLNWSSTMADSVVVTNQGARLAGAANGSTTGSLTYSNGSAGDYTMIASAYSGDVVAATDQVIIKIAGGGGGGGGNGPSISVNGVLSSYNQGELVNFTVTANNTSGNQISLNSSSLPANASFGNSGGVTGFSPLSGTFTWTPDVSQSGLFTVRFTATDAGGTSTRDVTLQINELQFDRLFSTSRSGNKPVGGLRGRKEIAFPIDLVTSQTVYGVQFDMFWPANFIKIDSFITTARTFDYIVVENLGTTPGEVRVVTYNLDNQPVRDTNTTAVLQAILTLDSSTVAWTDYTIHLDNGRESVNPDPGVGSVPLVTDSGIVQVDSVGDVNLDKFIDVADAVNIVGAIINNFTLSARQFETADVVTDGEVNVFDLVADVNLIFNIAPDPVAAPATGPEAVMSLAYDDVAPGGSDMVVVRSEIPPASDVAGVQLEMSYDPSAVSLGSPSLTELDGVFRLQSKNDGAGKMTMVLYQLAPAGSGTYLQGGVNELVEIPMTARTTIKTGDKTKLRLTDALLATSLASAVPVSGVDRPLPLDFTLSQNYPNPFNPTTVIEFSIPTGQAEVDLDVFNVLGQHVITLFEGRYPAGEYQVTWDATDKNGKRVATGVYLYRLRVDDERKTKKMLFLK